jgi:hypothetical protein
MRGVGAMLDPLGGRPGNADSARARDPLAMLGVEIVVQEPLRELPAVAREERAVEDLSLRTREERGWATVTLAGREAVMPAQPVGALEVPEGTGREG